MVDSMRQRKMERTRELIVAAGMVLFAERGFEAVTVADIAARADVAPRTFHRYFPDKAELVFAGDTELREALEAALQQEVPTSGLRSYLIVVLQAACQPLAGRHAELVAREGLLREVPALRARDLAKQFLLAEIVAEHLAHRLGVPLDQDVRPRWWAGVTFATFTAGYQTWLIRGGSLSAHLGEAAGLLPEADHPDLPGVDSQGG